MYTKTLSKEERRDKNRKTRNSIVIGIYLFLAGGLCGYGLCLHQSTMKDIEEIQQVQAKPQHQEEEHKPGLLWRVLERRFGG